MAGELILIVEDNEMNMKLVRDILQFKGYRTLEAETALDAIALATEHAPDLVLMDIQLPGMDGVAALGRLRGEPGTASLRVVALTAFAMRDDREKYLGLGFDEYMTKPIDIKRFPEFIRQQCELARQGE